MPLRIIRQDITKMRVDAIVNTTNQHLFPGGGVDAAIHDAAGQRLLEACGKLGGCPLGEARITEGFDLPAKYVIHTVGPEWQGGESGERALLRSCYRESLALAEKNGCETVALPLISSGLYGYPKDKVLKEAVDVISDFLSSHEMEVFLLVYDKSAYTISRELYSDVQTFVDNFYVEAHFDRCDSCREEVYYRSLDTSAFRAESNRSLISRKKENRSDSARAADERLSEIDDLGEMLDTLDKGFADTLFYYIDKKGLTDVEAYKRSNVGKKTFSKIKCNKDYRPGKITAVSFAIGLHLDIEETRHLLATAGMCLSRSNRFDVIIEYFITSGKYETIFDVNEVLYQFDQSLLGV